jgi:long-chain fatty acid transport protein
MLRPLRALRLPAVILVVVCVPQHVRAAGFFLSQQSVQGIGRAFAGGAAVASDASTIFANPAGMTELERAEISLGISVLAPVTDFDNRGSTAATPGTLNQPVAYSGAGGGNPFTPAALPNFYAAVPLKDRRVWVGLGVTMPFGLRTEYPDDWFGRYDSIDSQLTTVDIQPSLAVRLTEWLSIGGGVDIQYAQARLTSAIPDPVAAGGPTAATDGRNRLKGDDWSLGGNIGVLVKPWPSTRIGVHYRSGINHSLDGSNRVSGLTGPLAGANGSVDGKADLRLPDIVSVAIAQTVAGDWTLLAEGQWFNWSRFNEVRVERDDGQPDMITLQNYKDSYALATGVEYAPGDRWRWRLGFRYETAATRDRTRTTSVPDADNYSVGLGATVRITDNVRVDAALFHTIWETAKIDLTRRYFEATALESEVNVRGRANSSSTTFGLNMRILF